MRYASILFSVLAFGLFLAKPAFAATFSVIPDGSSASVGADATFTVIINTEGAAVNAGQATLSYPTDVLQVTSLNTSDSIFNFWINAPSYSNDTGTIQFLGGATNGFNGQSLRVFQITATVLKEGAATIAFTDGAITASDGSGTNVLTTMHGATVTGVTAPVEEKPPEQITRKAVPAATAPAKPVLSIPLYPDDSKWYNVLSPFIVSWNLPPDVTDVATELDQDPKYVPKTSEGLFDNKIFRLDGDGVSYLHVRFKNNIGWGETAHVRLAVDTLPPSSYEIHVDPSLSSDVPTPSVTYASSDQLSGLVGYEIQLDGGTPVATSEPTYAFPPIPPGTHLVSVSAIDQAGNSTNASVEIVTVPIPSPTLSPLPSDIYVGEGKLNVGGTAQQGVELLVTLESDSGELVGSTVAAPDENGTWGARFDQPLKKGGYRVTVVAKDTRGAQSLPVSADFTAVPRPFLVIGGVAVSQAWVFLTVILLLGAGYVVGWRVQVMQRERRGWHVLIAEREVGAAFEQTQKELEQMRDAYKKPLSETGVAELRTRLKRLSDRIQKVKQYILDHIEEING